MRKWRIQDSGGRRAVERWHEERQTDLRQRDWSWGKQRDSKGDWATLYIFNTHKQRMDWRALFTLHTFRLGVRWSHCSHYTLWWIPNDREQIAGHKPLICSPFSQYLYLLFPKVCWALSVLSGGFLMLFKIYFFTMCGAVHFHVSLPAALSLVFLLSVQLSSRSLFTGFFFRRPPWGSWGPEGALTGQARPDWSVLNSKTSWSSLRRPVT